MGMGEGGQMPPMGLLESIPALVERAVQDLPQFRKLLGSSSVANEASSSLPLVVVPSNLLQPVLFSWDSSVLSLMLATLVLLLMYILKYTIGLALPSESVAWRYYPLFLLLRAFIVLACHNFWLVSLQGNSFFGFVKQIDDSRNPKTGRYRKSNFLIVRKLLKEFGAQKAVFGLYFGKQVVQLVVSLLSIFINFIFAGFLESSDQGCTANSNSCHGAGSHMFNEAIYSLDNCLLFLVFVLSAVGLGWSFMGHTRQLGYIAAARFSYASHLPANSHVNHIPPASVTVLPLGFNPIQKLLEALFHSPKIQNDLDFLLLMLDHTNSSKADVVRELLVEHELQKLLNQDFELIKKMLLSQQQGFMDEEIKGTCSHMCNVWLCATVH